MSNCLYGGPADLGLQVDKNLELLFRGDFKGADNYLRRKERGEAGLTYDAVVVEVVEGKKRDTESWERRVPKRKLTSGELRALGELFSGGPISFSDLFDHLEETSELASALELLLHGPTTFIMGGDAREEQLTLEGAAD